MHACMHGVITLCQYQYPPTPQSRCSLTGPSLHWRGGMLEGREVGVEGRVGEASGRVGEVSGRVARVVGYKTT